MWYIFWRIDKVKNMTQMINIIRKAKSYSYVSQVLNKSTSLSIFMVGYFFFCPERRIGCSPRPREGRSCWSLRAITASPSSACTATRPTRASKSSRMSCPWVLSLLRPSALPKRCKKLWVKNIKLLHNFYI